MKYSSVPLEAPAERSCRSFCHGKTHFHHTQFYSLWIWHWKCSEGGGIILHTQRTHLFNHLFCFLGSHLHTDKYCCTQAAMLLFITIMDLENLLDVMESNPITLILWKILLVCRNLHHGMYLLAWSKLKRYWRDYFLFWDFVVTSVRFLEIFGQADVLRLSSP